jgi:predicted metal-dependent phosphotriesterase family hydrolase
VLKANPGPFVRTVTGDVAPSELGVTYAHEHVLARPAGDWARSDPDLVIDDLDRAAVELEMFRSVGGGTLVDATTAELGRDAEGLHSLALRTGVNLVASTGHVCEEYWRGALSLEGIGEGALAARFTAELTQGIGDTRVRAGVIKVGSSLGGPTESERRLILAGAAAHRATGAPITTHTTAGTGAIEQIRALEGAGVDLSRVCVGHLDRRLVWSEHLAVAGTGVFLGYDCIGKEHYQPDAERVRFILRLVDEGFGGRILLAGDMARRRYLRAWGGGPGYLYIAGDFAGRLRAAGLDDPSTRRLLVDNPAAFLAWD